MFPTHTLPPPTSFGHEHRPLRLTSESARSYPRGGCHYQQTQTQAPAECMCQSFQHDRSAPGNLCDCGHSACYHSQTSDAGKVPTERILSALTEKVKTLEDVVIRERSIRDNLILRERKACEREIRLLREALSPTHRNDLEMRKALLNLEDKLDRYHEEHMRLKDQLGAVDSARSALERRLENIEISKSRKRKASTGLGTIGAWSPQSTDTSCHSDTTSASHNRSPSGRSPVLVGTNADVPQDASRSHGTLVRTVKNKSDVEIKSYGHSGNDHDEPRSSGFLSINLTERLQRQQSKQTKSTGSARSIVVAPTDTLRSVTSNGLPSPPDGPKLATPSLSTPSCHHDPLRMTAGYGNPSPKRRKHQKTFLALDILANASVANPLMH